MISHTKHIEDAFRATHYHAGEYPTARGGEATNVSLRLHVEHIGPISTADFKLSVFLIAKWRDDRLAAVFKAIDADLFKNNRSVKYFRLADSTENMVWRPPVYFRNAVMAEVGEVTMSNRNIEVAFSLVNSTIQSYGFYIARINLKLSCKTDLRNFPFDVQRCPIHIGLLGYQDSEVKLRWMKGRSRLDENVALHHEEHPAVTVAKSALRLDEFKLTSWESRIFKIYMWKGEQTTVLESVFILDRLFTYYLAQIYVPTGFLVIISWFSFWLDPEAVPARVSISIIMLLTLQTASSGLSISMPRVSYFKAVDVWLILCQSIVFLSLVEFIFIHTYMRKMRNARKDSEQMHCQETAEPNAVVSAETGRARAVMIDKIFRWVSLPMFLLCNIIYWSVFLT